MSKGTTRTSRGASDAELFDAFKQVMHQPDRGILVHSAGAVERSDHGHQNRPELSGHGG